MKHEIDMKKFNIHTDMAIDKLRDKSIGITTNFKVIDNIKITDIILDEKNGLNKEKGNYITIEFNDITDYDNYSAVKKVFSKELKKMLKKLKISKDKKCLIIGLGNENSTPDSLGAKVVSNIVVTRHLEKLSKLSNNYISIATLVPKVIAQTGIDSYDIVEAVINKIKPDFLIVIDSTGYSARLLTYKEINDNFEFEEYEIPCGGCGAKENKIISSFMYNSNYDYWTMSEDNSKDNYIWYMSNSGILYSNCVFGNCGNYGERTVIRSVIIISKSAL